MGYNVGSLTRVPLEVYDHCIFVVGDPKMNKRALWIQKNFARLTQSLPRKTALVAGTNHQVSEEVLGLICEAAEDDDGEGKGWRHFAFLADHTSLVISKGNIRKTNSPLILVPLGGMAGDADSDEFMGVVFEAVCEAIRDGRVDELVEELGAVHVPLRPFKPGMKVATLRRWNEVLHLKPSVVGIGFNLNAAIEQYLDDLELEGRPVKIRATAVSCVADPAVPGAGAWRVVTRVATRLHRRLREMAGRP
jgi:hypothetical protein